MDILHRSVRWYRGGLWFESTAAHHRFDVKPYSARILYPGSRTAVPESPRQSLGK